MEGGESPGLESRGSPGHSVGKSLPVNAGDAGDSGLISGSGRSPREGNGNLPGEIPWTEEPGRLQAMGSQESDMT